MLRVASALIPHRNTARAYVGGSAPIPDHDPTFADTIASRTFVREKLAEWGFPNPDVRFQSSDESTIMRIDTRTGAVEFDVDQWQPTEEE